MVEKYFSGTGNSKYSVELSMIQRMCQLLKDELLDNGYEYGFYLNLISMRIRLQVLFTV